MERSHALEKFGLKFNPFPPAATGSAFIKELWTPASWADAIEANIQQLATGEGAKATMIVGSYGSGKTFLLQRMKNEFEKHRIRSYFFDNPETTFYALADQLLRQVGRYELSKAMWEMLYDPELSPSLQQRLFDLSFPDWLLGLKDSAKRTLALRVLQEAMIKSEMAEEEEVAARFAHLIVDTRDRPYYEFRDFVPRTPHSLVAERQEAKYFKILIRILLRVFEVEGIAFLIDEFEAVALGKRMAKRQSAEYTATVRRLLDTAAEEEFWLALSITPEGLEQTNDIEPSLIERFGPDFWIPPLEDQDSYNLIQHRLQEARIDSAHDGLWPFEEESIKVLQPTNRVVARKLIKVFGHALALAIRQQVAPPISATLVTEAEQLHSEQK